MGFFGDAYRNWSPMYSAYKGDWSEAGKRLFGNSLRFLGYATGYTQYKNTQASVQAQIDYNDYIKAGNERALADWNKYVGSQGREIKYPELSYAGAIYRADTGTARAMYDSSTAGANFYGNLPYRTAGLYGIGSRVSRRL